MAPFLVMLAIIKDNRCSAAAEFISILIGAETSAIQSGENELAIR